MMEMLEASLVHLPEERPRYAMGIGLPLNLIDMVSRGVDMFDCALPTRNARNGEVFLWPRGFLRLKHARFKDDHTPIDPLCDCLACAAGVKRSYLAHLLRCDEIAALTYCSLHNLRFYQRLTARLRREIAAGTLDAFCEEFFA